MGLVNTAAGDEDVNWHRLHWRVLDLNIFSCIVGDLLVYWVHVRSMRKEGLEWWRWRWRVVVVLLEIWGGDGGGNEDL